MKSVFWIVIVIYVFGATFLLLQFPDFKIAKNGKIVQMKITEIPGNVTSTKVKYHMTLSYKGKTFDKQIGVLTANRHSVGEMINMRYLEGNDKILFPQETGMLQFASGIFIALLGVFAIIFFLRYW